jgi:hypothetical protein
VLLEFLSYENEEDLWMNDIIPTHRQNTADFRADEAAAIAEVQSLAEQCRAEIEELAVRRITGVFDSVADVHFTDAATFARNKQERLAPIILTRAKVLLTRLETERRMTVKKTIPKKKGFVSAKKPAQTPAEDPPRKRSPALAAWHEQNRKRDFH